MRRCIPRSIVVILFSIYFLVRIIILFGCVIVLFYNSETKIVQIECRISSLLEYYAEMQPILYKDNAKIRKNEE